MALPGVGDISGVNWGTAGGWTGGGLWGGPASWGLPTAPAGGLPGGPTGWEAGLGGWGMPIPTAAGAVQRGPVPQYFTATPTGFAPLSPLAQAYLSRMFPAGLWGEETKEYTITPSQAAQPAMVGSYGELLKAAVSGVPAVTGITEKVPAKPASAQLYRQLESQGALPNLRQYITDILGIPWETYVGTMQAYWPAAQQERPVQWRIAKQR